MNLNNQKSENNFVDLKEDGFEDRNSIKSERFLQVLGINPFSVRSIRNSAFQNQKSTFNR